MQLTEDPRFMDWPESGWRRTESLLAFANNPRTHTIEQVKQIARSIEEFGFTNPILIDDSGTIIAGHGRCEAARQLKIKQVPVIVLTGLSDDQLRAYVIADNQLAQNAGWDEGLLALELGALNDTEFDLSVIGFEDDVLSKYLDEPVAGFTDPDDVPEAPERPITQMGDVWILDQHRLMCGDAESEESVDALLVGAVPFQMITDPPYGVEYDPAWRDELNYAPNRRRREVGNDHKSTWIEAYKLFPGDIVYVWHGGMHSGSFVEGIEGAGFQIRTQIIWVKPRGPIGRGHYHWAHEACFYAVKKGKTAQWSGDRKQSTVWEIPFVVRSEDGTNTGHSAQKPAECMQRPMENHGGKDDAIYDPFVGSGTTLIAAERTGRQCFAMDVDPVYIDVAVVRWQLFTGKRAILESTGQAFDDILAERNNDDPD